MHAIDSGDRSHLAEELVGLMLEGVGQGAFVPTDDESDCRLCDYAEICRVRTSGFGSVSSPPASWAKERAADGLDPAFRHLKAVRGFEDQR